MNEEESGEEGGGVSVLGKVLLGVGALGVLCSGFGIVLNAASPVFAHVSPEEQLPGFIGGGCCCATAVMILFIGVAVMLMAKKSE